MEQKAITQEEKTKKEQIRQAENRHKYIMGGVVHMRPERLLMVEKYKQH